MKILNVRRLGGVLAAAGVLLVAAAGPARAAEGPIKIGLPDIEVPVGGSSIDLLGLNVWSTTGPAKYTGAKVTYELSGVSGVRLVLSHVGGGECTRPSPTRVECSDPRELSFEGETIEQYLPVEVRAAKSAEAGDSGTITVTFSADDVETLTDTSELRVIGDDQEALPVTGPTTWLIAAAGLLLLGAGLAGVLATRRRARFVA
jgi:hypothetical protein